MTGSHNPPDYNGFKMMIGKAPLYGEGNRLERMEALRLWTVGSAWFSSEEGKKGALVPGQLACWMRIIFPAGSRTARRLISPR